MPVTMYHSNFVNESNFLSMDMTNRSYKYYTGSPLYEFGFGLSYTNFTMSWSPPPPMYTVVDVTTPATTYTCTVTNIGPIAGDEVVVSS